MSWYTSPKLDGHTVIYKGRRFWVFEISGLHPFFGHEAHCDVIVYDKLHNCPIGFCDKNLNGYVSLGNLQGSYPIYGSNPEQLIVEVRKALKTFDYELRSPYARTR